MTRYDIGQSYDWNYDHAPAQPPRSSAPAVPGVWDFCGLPVNSPLGIPAGPLLNSRWILYYAALGFDVLTYKTVRSRYRKSYDPPNLLPVNGEALRTEGMEIEALRDSAAYDTWAISFGMPSKEPDEWRADVEKARAGLGRGQVLSVSVVASPEPEWTIDQLAADFALCSKWAAESGAQAVEANLSCPNVCTKEADLYLAPAAARLIAAAVRDAVPPAIPVLLKIGLFPRRAEAAALVEAVSPYADAISATNSITAVVRGEFGGLRRGVGGAGTTARCLEETCMLAGILQEQQSHLKLVSVGGVMNAGDVRDRLGAGAHHVQLATAPMIDPAVGLQIRKELAAQYNHESG
jgi:dihydroorotate dehydrogenase